MRIACLQFNPKLASLPENIARADALLEAESPRDIDLLLLPELAFTGTFSFPHPCPFPCPCPFRQSIFSPLTV